MKARVVHAVLMAWRYRRLMREARANHTWDRLQMRAEIDRLSAQQARLANRLAQEGMDRERAEEECRALSETVMDLRRALEGERKRAAGMRDAMDALRACRIELAYLIEQTGAREGGSVCRAYDKANEAIRVHERANGSAIANGEREG
jgi:hypothetical protein